jgi:hypothetical protein
MKRLLVLAAVACTAVTLAACSSSQSGGAVPSLAAGSAGTANGSSAPSSGPSRSQASRPRVGYSTSRVAELHAAAQCLREHGVPTYQDPVLTPGGFVYTDARSFDDIGRNDSQAQQDALLSQLRQACGHLFAVAGLQPDDESPAPPALVQAGVRSAECLRANGLPNYRDPTSDTPFTPGHGFGITADELPNNGALGKTDPTVQHALGACRSLLDAEITASSLSSLSHA